MTIKNFASRSLVIAVATLALASCSGGSHVSPAIPAAGAVRRVAGFGQLRGGRSYLVAAKSNAHGQIRHFKPWMEPGAVKNRLLYVSDFSANIVQVYNYPSQGTQNPPAGTLTGFSNPQGMCTDSHNDVLIANTGGENVLVYPYGSTSSSGSYSISGEYPVDCSIDRTTGNLAVSDIFSPTTGEGAVTICTSTSSCTTYVEPGGLLECYFIAYVPSGDLYVDGIATGTYTFGMTYLPHGSTVWQPATIEGSSIVFPGPLQYAGGYLVVGDQSGSSGSTLYRCTPSGSVVDCNGGSTVLEGASDVVQWFIKRGAQGVTGVDNGAKVESTWAYPAGSTRPNKTFTIDDGTYSTLIGNAVVLPPH